MASIDSRYAEIDVRVRALIGLILGMISNSGQKNNRPYFNQ